MGTRPVLERHPQDLLFRSAETPFEATLAAGQARILVKSNDPELLRALPGPQPAPGERPSFLWKLVRDDHSLAEAEEPVVLAADEVTTISFGPGCFAACDRRRRELVCFVGARIPAAAFREAMVPRFRELTEKALER